MTQIIGTFQKDPHDVLDYIVDWSSWLTPNSDTISTSTFTIPTGLTLTSQSNTTTTATAWISGGSAGVTYTITHQVTTVGGRTAQRSFQIVCLVL